jgi:serine/threonine-protein kinase
MRTLTLAQVPVLVYLPDRRPPSLVPLQCTPYNPPRMLLSTGTRLGVYEVVGLLGAGGMGEVFRARDTRLRRDVALKILPERFLDDPDRVARFQREAQLLASLNHPNIAVIHGLEESAGIQALVLELVEGRGLDEMLASAPRGMRLQDALGIARQIVDALDAAHEQGVIHRDLKPANIRVRPDGTVKVLDFGLAKLSSAADDAVSQTGIDEGFSLAATVSSPAMTRAGFIIGTAAYMSPEQARGRPVDKRADIWAFGCVLYEMLTGRRAFDGLDTADVLARVIERTPDLKALPLSTPAHLRRLLERCFEKDIRRRLRDIGDARLELDVEPRTSGEPAVSRRWAVSRIAAAGGLLAAGGLGVGWWAGRRGTSAPVPVTRLMVDVRPAEGLLGSSPLERLPLGRLRPSRTAIALSPDGRAIAFTARRGSRQSLYVRSLDRDSAVELPGTDGADGPFFSPDGRWIGFHASGSLRRVALAGGPAVTLCESPLPFGASWSSDDRVVFSQRDGIWLVPAGGGSPTRLTSLPAEASEVVHAHPRLLPGGEWLMYSVLPVFFGWNRSRVVVQSIATGERRTIVEGAADAQYLPTGHLVYMRTGTLMGAVFDLATMKISSGEVGLTERVVQAVNTGAIPLDTGSAQYAVSRSGTLAFVRGDILPDFVGTPQWIDRNGSVTNIQIPAPARPFIFPRLSPDGKSLAIGTLNLNSQDLWRYDIAERALTRLTSGGRMEHPVWSPDGARIALGYSDGGPYNIVVVQADGSGQMQRLTSGPPVTQFPGAWTPDGRTLVYAANSIRVVSLDPKPSTRILLEQPFAYRMPDLSPDGRWLAYVSNETDANEVYVQSFPQLGNKRRISTDGGLEPAWSRNGRKLLFLSPQTTAAGPRQRIMEVDVSLAPTFSAGAPRVVVELDGNHYSNAISARAWDVTADAQRFVFVHETYPPADDPMDEIQIVQSWHDDVRRRVDEVVRS